MIPIDFDAVKAKLIDKKVERPNKSSAGTLSGHAAGEPFEKEVYHTLKKIYGDIIFKQYEFLNDMFRRHPNKLSVEQRYALFDSPAAQFLLSRGDKATKEWSPEHIFEEKQNDTADILCYGGNVYNLIDVKTRNISKSAQPPNIISAYKLAQTCRLMLENDEFDTIEIDYIEIDWIEEPDGLRCVDAHHGNLFSADPHTLYINWAAGMQIQFHVCDLDQSWEGTRREWAVEYLRAFVHSAEHRCEAMRKKYIEPFLPYIQN